MSRAIDHELSFSCVALLYNISLRSDPLTIPVSIHTIKKPAAEQSVFYQKKQHRIIQ